MWGIFIIVFKPTGKLRHHSFGIRSIVAEDVIPFECFDIPKPLFNACQHDALRHVSTVPTSGGGIGHHFSVASI